MVQGLMKIPPYFLVSETASRQKLVAHFINYLIAVCKICPYDPTKRNQFAVCAAYK